MLSCTTENMSIGEELGDPDDPISPRLRWPQIYTSTFGGPIRRLPRAGYSMSDSLTDDEFERRFLVAEPSILKGAEYQEIHQAYVWKANGYAIRVRAMRHPQATTGTAFLSLKGPRGLDHQYSRYEAETPIDYQPKLRLRSTTSTLSRSRSQCRWPSARDDTE